MLQRLKFDYPKKLRYKRKFFELFCSDLKEANSELLLKKIVIRVLTLFKEMKLFFLELEILNFFSFILDLIGFFEKLSSKTRGEFSIEKTSHFIYVNMNKN